MRYDHAAIFLLPGEESDRALTKNSIPEEESFPLGEETAKINYTDVFAVSSLSTKMFSSDIDFSMNPLLTREKWRRSHESHLLHLGRNSKFWVQKVPPMEFPLVYEFPVSCLIREFL